MQNVKLGEVLNDTFPVTAKKGKPVTGLVDKDFQKVLYGPDGADLSEQTPVTISELGKGMYRLNFRPNKVGHWAITISNKQHCPAGLSSTYEVGEADETSLEEHDEDIDTPYVILRHWPDKPTQHLSEHWDIKMKNKQGVVYEWSSADDPFEHADGVLGEAGSCCNGDKAFDIEGAIDLVPGSEWNPSDVLTHLEGVQSGQVHFLEEEPGMVIAYLDQLPFRAVQEGSSDEWDITLGVWASMSKQRYTALMALPAEEYDTKDLTDQILGDDWRITTSWLATLNAGKEIDKTEDQIIFYIKKLVNEIGGRNLATFNLERMGEPSKQILVDTLWDLYGDKGIYEPQRHAEMINAGSKTMKLEQDPWDLSGFYGLIDGKKVVGMIRFEQRQEINEAAFEKLSDAHQITTEEMNAWGWKFPLYGWNVREYVSLNTSKPVTSGTQWARDEMMLATEDSKVYAELRNLVEHTEDELRRAGLFDEDSDYGGMMAHSVMAIMKLFAKQGHSGFSAQMCRELFQRLSNFETLMPITSDPAEWQDTAYICNGEKGKLWQNIRNPAMFS
ncbi:hypothetical protein LCGC14_2078470, partial [marine sediment metagenome]